PGGAGNVARSAAALGAQVMLISVVGDDEAGRTLERLLAAARVHTSLHRDATLPTTVKLRVIGRQQQLLRIDFETLPSHEILASRAQRLRAELGISALLVTRAEEGMSLFTDAGSLNFSAEAREVYDVSGAGDTVIATLGALLGAHADLASAVRIANQAAGIVV